MDIDSLQAACSKGLEIFRVKPDPICDLRERFLFSIIDEAAPGVLSNAELYALADTRINEIRKYDEVAGSVLHSVLWGDQEETTH